MEQDATFIEAEKHLAATSEDLYCLYASPDLGGDGAFLNAPAPGGGQPAD